VKALSLRVFIWLSVGLTALRMASAIAYLLFGPALDVAPQHVTTQVFFVLSKAFLGGLFWPVSLALAGFSNPLGWLFYPWWA
jgi:uncharacterized membrane protein YraQ (UPF0718 family)